MDTTNTSDDLGCAHYGCGCLWGLAAVFVVTLLIVIPQATSFSILSVVLVPPMALLVPGAVLGLVARKFPLASATRRRLGTVGKYLLGFSGLCLITAVGLTLRPGGFSFEDQVSAEGGTVGPVTLEEGDMHVEVEVEQDIASGTGTRYQRWSFVTVELLDENKEYLSSFGGEFWHYEGYDNEGYHWEEADDEYVATIEVPSPGTYYLRLQTEANVDSAELSPVRVDLNEQMWWGRPTPLQAAGYVAFFLGMILVVIPSEWGSSVPELKEGMTVRVRGRSWSVRGRANYVYDDWRAEEWTLHATGPGVKKPRYLEREYEADSNWEAWFWSTPVVVDDIRTDDDGPETGLGPYAEAQGTLPDTITYENTQFRLNDSGTTRRNGALLSYHTYQESRKDDVGRSITIEGEPPDELSVVVTNPLKASEIEVETEED
jgi:hypothetical protein